MTDPNPFLQYLSTHPGADMDALKRLFRILAKRTHPDLGAANHDSFVRLQESYHTAVSVVLGRRGPEAGGDAPEAPSHQGSRSATSPPPPPFPGAQRTPREQMLHHLYRYKAHLPAHELDAGSAQGLAVSAYAQAMEAAGKYDPGAFEALRQFNEQFHKQRRIVSRYPDVRTKYILFMRGFASAFDYLTMPNDFNLRVARSYLEGIRPVTDYDPTTSPALRSNRSAPARAALFRMKVLLLSEIDRGLCNFL